MEICLDDQGIVNSCIGGALAPSADNHAWVTFTKYRLDMLLSGVGFSIQEAKELALN